MDGTLKLYVVNVSTLVEISELTPDSLPYEKARFFKQMPVLRKNKADSVAANKLAQYVSQHPKAISDKSDKQ